MVQLRLTSEAKMPTGIMLMASPNPSWYVDAYYLDKALIAPENKREKRHNNNSSTTHTHFNAFSNQILQSDAADTLIFIHISELSLLRASSRSNYEKQGSKRSISNHAHSWQALSLVVKDPHDNSLCLATENY